MSPSLLSSPRLGCVLMSISLFFFFSSLRLKAKSVDSPLPLGEVDVSFLPVSATSFVYSLARWCFNLLHRASRRWRKKEEESWCTSKNNELVKILYNISIRPKTENLMRVRCVGACRSIFFFFPPCEHRGGGDLLKLLKRW